MTPSPYLGIAYLTGALEYPRPRLPRQFHLIGPSITGRRGDHGVDFPWEWLDGRPVVLLSMGTIFLKQDRFYRSAIDASRGQNWQLVVRVGPGHEKPPSPAIPDNVLLVDEQPQLQLLKKTAVMISHAGVNSCVEALAEGVPLLLAPAALDQRDFSQRILHAGAGLRVSLRRPRTAIIRKGIQRLLTEPSFGHQARRIAADFALCDAPRTGARLIEALLATGEPVLRPDPSVMTTYRFDQRAGVNA